MGIVIDLIIIGVIALCTFIGYKQGLIKSAIKILSFIIAIVVALILYKPVTNVIINNTGIDDSIKNKIVESILPEGVSADEEVEIQNTIPNMIIESGKGTVNKVAETITVQILETGSLLVIFILVRIGLKFVTALTDLITKLPVLKQFDKTGGIIYGIVRGVVLVFVIFAVISLFSPVMETSAVDTINKSLIGKVIYNNNILLNTLF